MRAVHVIVVIPCYNEAARLQVETLRAFRPEGFRCEFLFVDDGSRDGTRDLLRRIGADDPARFSLLALDRNRGKAEAVRLGVLEALNRRPDLVGFWDADLATPLEELPRFVEIFRENDALEVVMGARVRLLGRSISRNPARHYVGRIGATLISRTLHLAVYDTQCGAKLFRPTPEIAQVFHQPFLSRWIFDVEILARLVKLRGRDDAATRIYELPLLVWHDVQGSKVRPTDFIRALRDLRRIRRAYSR